MSLRGSRGSKLIQMRVLVFFFFLLVETMFRKGRSLIS
jgi:hypothetical protein